MFNLIKKIFWQIKNERLPMARCQLPSSSEDGFDPLIYSLESPNLLQYRLNEVNVFRGWILYFGNKAINALNIYLDDRFIDSFQVNMERKDVSMHISGLPAAENCGFNLELDCSKPVRRIRFEVVYHGGQKNTLFDYDVEYIVENKDLISGWSKCVNSLNMPDREIVHLTQGHDHVEEYKNSILPSVLCICDYLLHSGVKLDQIKDILDFGCGSGRILKGWHCIQPDLHLHGCDYNRRLVDWNRKHLPEDIEIIQNNLKPPLEYADNKFDFIYLISVFTHLSLTNQKKWISEIQRLLRPDGLLLVTLHGEFYVRNTFFKDPAKVQSFRDNGYESMEIENSEGGNQFGFFHSYGFVKRLFNNFSMIGYFPQGNSQGIRRPFRVALAQDVYIFRYLGR